MTAIFKKMNPIKRLYWGMIGIGLGMGIIFPFYANWFVDWLPGRLVFFVIGCLLAGLSVGLLNYYIMKKVLGYVIERSFKKVETHLGENIIQQKETNSFGTEHFQILDDIFKDIGEVFSHVYKNQEKIEELMLNSKNNITSLKNNTTEVATSSQEVSASIEEIATAMEDLSLHSSNIVNFNQKTHKGLENNEEEVQLGNTYLNKALKAMNNLEEKIDHINDIFKTTQKISEQTEMLALNASVEAVKTGDNNGFKVVAEEIRKLAEKSTKASKEIYETLESIHKASYKVIKVITGSEKNQLETQQKYFDDNIKTSITDIFSNISTSSHESLNAMDEIVDETREQAVSTQQVSASTQQISAAIQQVASNTQMVNNITDDLVEDIEQTITASNNLMDYIQEKIGDKR
ncbi:methyl-accepting chemotaxis protein [Selenihalanaerobacter shriftii]|uniref:Methyl-accepting chemotaxis protein n=1 Tax=Selenihalanaerobacter shriftii TaxID=142842 RepID=A0A1T4M4Z9_9FIRM|nr:methyl-accepting chemotaxis protein [Selenihalanaerobacter shriftii]SJZ62090.1 Methyl-accepting chemotaxis protein [Selenihalanaerobacter shriftii]